MAVPAELMQLLQGAGGGAQGGAPQPPPAAAGGPPMGGDGPSPQEAASSPFYGGGGIGDNVQALRAALDSLAEYNKGEDDEQNIQTVLKCIAQLQAILASEEKMVDGALGGNADPRAMRRLSGGQGAGASSGPSY